MSTQQDDKNILQKRPAEITSASLAIAVLISRILGVTDSTTITALAIVVGFTPAAVTGIVVWVRSQRAKGS